MVDVEVHLTWDYVIQFGNRDFSIYKHWCGLQPDLALEVRIAYVILGDAACHPRNEASVWLATRGS